MPNLDPILNRYINTISTRLYNVESQFFTIAGERLKSIYGLSDEQIKQYLYGGNFLTDTKLDVKKVEKALSQAHTKNLKDLSGLFNDITAEVYSTGKEIAEHKSTRLSPLTSYRQASNPLLRQVVRNYEVMSRSTTVNDTYKKTIRQYVNRLEMGGEDNAPSAMRKAIRELTAQGISHIDYKSGRSVRMDSAVRRDLMGEYTEIVQGVERKLGEEIGAQHIEVSVEHACAWDHENVQGRIFSNEEFEKIQNGEIGYDIDGKPAQLGGDRQIGQYNCRHSVFPFLLGISEPSYSQEELKAVNDRNEKGIEYKGEKISIYAATQYQRKLETAMRYAREQDNLLKSVRETSPEMESDYRKNRARLAELRNEYHVLGDKLKPLAIREKMERSYVPRGSIGAARL
jgi:hypothetical protein